MNSREKGKAGEREAGKASVCHDHPLPQMTKPIVYTLPWAPSINRYWRSIVRGNRPCQIISAKGREFRAGAAVAIKSQGLRRYEKPVLVCINLHPPTRRRYDVDLDATQRAGLLTHAGVLADDELVYELRIRKCERVKGGQMLVRIEPEAA